MSRLLLLRHAKAGWAKPGMRDFDRPLEKSGIEDAKATGETMTAMGYIPDLTLCSTATRARETLQAVAEHADTGRVTYMEELYRADAAGYLEIIREHGASGSILVVGHNPVLEDLATALSASDDQAATASLRKGFATSGLAVLRFDGALSEAERGRFRLEAFLTPARS
ncbi:histidine phosphatase family protein [Mesorhizobium sp. SB112]|uniref:SixA phosphatase family protein n=1 Tax=Mesorhizobium sp. SB112 TaxID=3151853 RepID=UPI003266C84C